jgi:hypothetical protein
MPADADALAFLPSGYARADGLDHSGDLVTRHAWIVDTRPYSFIGHGIAMADSTSFNLDAHEACSRFRNFPLNDFQ